MRKQKLKFKKLLNEYRSLFYEMQYVVEILKDANPEFEIYYRQYCTTNDIDLDELNKTHATRVQQVFSSCTGLSLAEKEEDRRHEFDSKKLFRQIAKRFHPDVMSIDDPRKEEYEEVFKKASGAIDQGRWGDLFDVAERYDLDLDDYGAVNKSLRLDIGRIKKEIFHKKESYAWLLQECEDSTPCKDNVVKRFLKHLFNI